MAKTKLQVKMPTKEAPTFDEKALEFIHKGGSISSEVQPNHGISKPESTPEEEADPLKSFTLQLHKSELDNIQKIVKSKSTRLEKLSIRKYLLKAIYAQLEKDLSELQ
ncbi:MULTISPECIES: hypothetical protein [unclassified Siphonobacter]|uniref:hypothetical protein n=1 Tax=unclassified Siphonobacter TaxID=2635712 RepID=UPI00277D29FD|nr:MULTISPECIES: hypothetical protein [unclassified Siphonobacter]MDQ1085522.1 hypothetical protein [Siphonobacter sp. SORGH_AS_1065]MDR6197394.1 hypothetical protein [Siphonobacter sp. SORGH_AS_0500]